MATNTDEAKADVTIPGRLESIEELLGSAHAAVSRMQPRDDSAPTEAAGGVEAAVARVQNGLKELLTRINGVADTVGQL
ncbi:hypothetical protein LCGC14_1125710 [marine sediment metagenome]|uniref:Uncharacterized protein n=1 Tax=marine sediment metagenome TaxID=412755 RepID=A0A0F9Q8F7_9ZZZZ